MYDDRNATNHVDIVTENVLFSYKPYMRLIPSRVYSIIMVSPKEVFLTLVGNVMLKIQISILEKS